MYTDLLTKIKNAQGAGKPVLKTGYSRMDMDIAEILVRFGFLKAVAKKGRLPKRVMEVELKYDEATKQAAIRGIRFVSTSSRRLYSGYRKLKSVKQGYGIAVLSTPMGVMTAQEAKQKKVGGQMLFEIW